MEENCERTTQGNKWITEAAYEYNAANRLAIGTNAKGEKSVYTYNGLGQRVRNEYIVQDNAYDYTTFDCTPPSVEVGFENPEVVVRDFVIDQTSPIEEVLVESEKDGFDYRYTVGLDRISVNVLSPASDTNHERTQTATKQWLHSDRLGSTVNSTDSFGRVTERTDYNEWGCITFHEPIQNTLGYRTINTDRTYTNHDYDVVLGLYYAKARMYDAEDKRFAERDAHPGYLDNVLSINHYLYVLCNSLKYIDPDGNAAQQFSSYDYLPEFGNVTIENRTYTTFVPKMSGSTNANAGLGSTFYVSDTKEINWTETNWAGTVATLAFDYEGVEPKTDSRGNRVSSGGGGSKAAMSSVLIAQVGSAAANNTTRYYLKRVRYADSKTSLRYVIFMFGLDSSFAKNHAGSYYQVSYLYDGLEWTSANAQQELLADYLELNRSHADLRISYDSARKNDVYIFYLATLKSTNELVAFQRKLNGDNVQVVQWTSTYENSPVIDRIKMKNKWEVAFDLGTYKIPYSIEDPLKSTIITKMVNDFGVSFPQTIMGI